ncbi:MAG TPA: hypothetical protein PK289_10095 [Bacteroidia bacterium]|nr:hypothetical protein [Bacteroidia bacterium]
MSFEYKILINREADNELLEHIHSSLKNIDNFKEVVVNNGSVYVPNSLSAEWGVLASVSKEGKALFISTILNRPERNLFLDCVTTSLEKLNYSFEIEEE